MSTKKATSIRGKVMCGDWIYPSSQSSTRVQYSIDFPLVLELFIQKSKGDRKISDRGGISHHFNGPRFIEVEITKDTLNILHMGNENEEDFKKNVSWSCNFDVSTLDRLSDISVYDNFEERFENISSSSDSLSILFTSILLQQHNKKKKKLKLPKGISFRKSTIPEIESLGRW